MYLFFYKLASVYKQMHNRKYIFNQKWSVSESGYRSHSIYCIHESMETEFLNANFQAPNFHTKNTIKFLNVYLEGNRQKQSHSVLIGHTVDTSTLCGKMNFVSHRRVFQTKFVDGRLECINGT